MSAGIKLSRLLIYFFLFYFVVDFQALFPGGGTMWSVARV